MRDCLESSLRSARWLLLLALAAPFQAPAQTEGRVKLKVPGPVAARQAMSGATGKLVADYGTFQILEVDEATAGELLKNPEVSHRDDFDYLALSTGRIQTASTEARLQAAQAPETFTGRRLHLIQFAGPVKPEWVESLQAAGVKIVGYVPENAYLVYGEYGGIQALHAQAASSRHVQWAGSYEDAHKIQSEVRRHLERKATLGTPGPDAYAIQLVDDPDANAGTLALVERLRQGPIRRDSRSHGYRNLIVPLRDEDLQLLAAQPEVVSIHAWNAPAKLCERQDMIISGNLDASGTLPVRGSGYLAWLTGKGFTQEQFTASGLVVDVSDSGIDNGTLNPNHFGLHLGGSVANGSRVVYNRLEGSGHTGNLAGIDGHGNINAHIIAGHNAYSFAPQLDGAGYHYGLGVCPFVKVGSSVVFDPNTWTNPDSFNLMARAYRDGARISSNSWGASSSAYDSDSRDYDFLVRDAQQASSDVPVAGNQEMTIVFSAGNDGPSSGSIGTPATAKNVIVVGASEDVNPFGSADGCGKGDTMADNAMDLATFSSRGPTRDGRIRPDIVAPGTHVSGGVPQDTRVDPTAGALGLALTGFTGDGICGGPSGGYFPTGQQWFSASSGTSHSCPAVAGAAALVRQYFINQASTNWPTPSPAMTKAYLLNAARYMTGAYTSDTLPSNNQGMGLLDLGRAFDGTARILKDQRDADLLTASGQARTVTGTIADTSKPFRVTLAWTDAPGSTSGNAWVNNLDLTVTAGGQTYKGNVFSGAYSTTGGAADARNNVESVYLPAGTAGAFQVTVTATNIAGDGVPNNATPLDQDYALVVYNATEGVAPVIAISGYSPTTEPNPGDRVTYQVTFQNIGSDTANNLSIQLQATGGVTSPSSGVLSSTSVPAGSTTSASYTFTVDPNTACGAALTLTFTVTAGTTSLGTVTQVLTTGTANCAPAITSFTPTAGPAGTSVAITGTKFSGATAVSFHGTAASFTVDSATRITATVPSGFTTGPITVTTPGGTATSAASFKSLDLRGNGQVDVADMAILAKSYGLRKGEPGYEDAADLNNDEKVNDADLQIWLSGF